MTKITSNCPFCEMEPEDHDEGAAMIASGQYGSRWAVFCNGCLARGSVKDTEEEAVVAWNGQT